MALFAAATSHSGKPQDATAHVSLWDAYGQAIYRYCFRHTADAALAEDLTSIVFLEAWRRRHNLHLATEDTLPWLYGVATNVLRNQQRSQRRYEAALGRLPPPLNEPDFADNLTERLADEQQMREILQALRKLSELEREVLSLCVWEGLTSQSAAVALSIPETTVRTRLHRAREHLRVLTGETRTSGRADSDVLQGDLP